VEQAYQQEESSWGEAFRVDQEDFQRWACIGDHRAAGQGEDGVRVFLLQLGSAGLVGGGLTAEAIDPLLERGEEEWMWMV
jgi:hypothetical protein